MYESPPRQRRHSASSINFFARPTPISYPTWSSPATGRGLFRFPVQGSEDHTPPISYYAEEEIHAREQEYDSETEGEDERDIRVTQHKSIQARRNIRTPALDWVSSPPLSPAEIKQTYASLPSSPAITSFSPTPTPFHKEETAQNRQPSPPPFSLWEYLREELLATDFDSHQELKWERVSNFLGVPIAVEKMISFGCILCLDSFLHTFTILPIRSFLAFYRAILNLITRSAMPLPPSQKADILRACLLVISIGSLLPFIDPSKIYHSIRGQDTIKLYVIFNALEIADRLFVSIGQDLLDCMFSRSTLLLLSHHIRPTQHTIRPIFFFLLSYLYTVAHSIILVYQLTALNVAINSYDNALLTLLLSNQFVEIKGSVFKKFEKDSLFQIACADVVERFQLSLMLVAIALRNLIELSSSDVDELSVLPKAFKIIRSSSLLWAIFAPVLTVLLSELAVDWLKHAFITKFNHIRPSVYERYIDVLCRDLAISQGSWVGRKGGVRKHTYVDQSPVVARRLGFASIPLAVLAVIIGYQSLSLVISNNSSEFIITATNFSSTHFMSETFPIIIVYLVDHAQWIALGIVGWLCLVTVKLIIGINLLSYANRRKHGMEERAKEDDDLNDGGPIGEGKDERTYNRELKSLLNQSRDDATLVPDMGEGKTRKKRVQLEELTRFTMIKRIW